VGPAVSALGRSAQTRHLPGERVAAEITPTRLTFGHNLRAAGDPTSPQLPEATRIRTEDDRNRR
jgi:hypothetical protein